MLTIGEYSRLTRISAKTLRYYDEFGLFKPVHVDLSTGYRFYSVEQLTDLYRILSLKELGLTLKQIRNVLNESITPEKLSGMLQLKKAQLEEMLDLEQRRLASIENMIAQLAMDGRAEQYDVILKEVLEMQIVLAREVVPQKSALSYTLYGLFRTVLDFLSGKGIAPVGHGFTVYFDEEYRDTQIDVGAAFPINAQISGAKDVMVTTLGATLMASVIHKGALEKMNNAYVALLHWIERNGYQITGASREVALQYDPFGQSEDYVTEIQFPVHKQPQ